MGFSAKRAYGARHKAGDSLPLAARGIECPLVAVGTLGRM
jgi:hypothetical protein